VITGLVILLLLRWLLLLLLRLWLCLCRQVSPSSHQTHEQAG
jgi:hypothetical protein